MRFIKFLYSYAFIRLYEQENESLVISECLSFADDVLLLDTLPLNWIFHMGCSQKHLIVFQVEHSSSKW